MILHCRVLLQKVLELMDLTIEMVFVKQVGTCTVYVHVTKQHVHAHVHVATSINSNSVVIVNICCHRQTKWIIAAV